jgi:hypothetical protein
MRGIFTISFLPKITDAFFNLSSLSCLKSYVDIKKRNIVHVCMCLRRLNLVLTKRSGLTSFGGVVWKVFSRLLHGC